MLMKGKLDNSLDESWLHQKTSFFYLYCPRIYFLLVHMDHRSIRGNPIYFSDVGRGFGPAIAAIILTALLEGRIGLTRLLS